MVLEKLKEIPIVQVASALGLKEARHSSKKNRMYFNPFGSGNNTPSIAVSEAKNVFKCHSTSHAGSVIDLVMFVKSMSIDQAIDWLCKHFNIERYPSTFIAVERTEKAKHVFIADTCLHNLKDVNAYQRMAAYLKTRAIAEEVIQRAVITKSIGFNLWHSSVTPVGQFGYGGEAVAFVARQLLSRQIACVDMRYLNAEANGGVKTQCQGDKKGVVWCSDYAHLKTAQTVFIVESPINALSIETLFLGKKTVAAVATLGVNNVDETDWEFLRGKKVVIAFDFDKPKKDGSVPGLQAAWKLLDKLVLLQISAFLLKYQDWSPDWDVNDVLVKHQEKLLRTDRSLGEYFLLDDALIAGTHKNLPKSSVYLPPVDKENYWRFRTHPEHTSYIETRLVTESDSEGNKERVEKEFFVDVCGFRIAGLVKIIVQGYLATVKGGTDDQQKTYYAAIVQTRKDGHQLVKKVFTHSIYDLKEWMPIGAIFDKDYFNRALTILENKARNNTIDSINFVGLAWKGEKLVVVEPPQTSFIKIDQQCNYPNFIFPRGTLEDARTIISAFEKTFDSQAALMMLNWTLNAHLKLFTGFYPHCFIQADKGVGKSRLLEILELVTGQRKFSADSLKSDFRLRTSLSGSSLPVSFDEISNMSEKSRKLLQDTLQTVYNFASTRTNSEMVEFVLFSPVMIAGEDIAFNSVISKTVVATLRACDRGAEIKVGELPKFPLRNWLEFLTRLSGAQFKTLYDECKQYMRKQLLSSDATSSRMIENYALQLAGWKLLCEFARYPENNGFVENLVIEMKRHIAETDTVRDPWIWVIEQIVSDIIQGKYSYPWTRMHINHIYPSGVSSAIDCLVIKPLEIMQHINQARDLVDFREKLPIKTKNALINQMRNACVLLKEEIKPYIEWQGKKQRFHAYVAINLSLLSAYGVFLPDNVSSDEFYKGYDE